jgi:tripartite-type tricarboxylate transporter receptor subunit TctC
MVINPSVPAKTVPEFIAYAKANPGRINMGSSGSGNVIVGTWSIALPEARPAWHP